ncbi:hypothetical protein BU26DRAFT_499386 [Trematosphaeria pertusa]|uniref:Uncharacterized protein n=1 Tax=Trematosphaeria pertusa TaxID=390896 RepID=A0A6A6J216_9PLEO|nr:uncharacterized protein BU26DRAFT_499386 [Trematosphaeria pertusa]KAF2256759.1 hypothetical protein BU26DRAFT_499386 [Trematosphaeria pertusa]
MPKSVKFMSNPPTVKYIPDGMGTWDNPNVKAYDATTEQVLNAEEIVQDTFKKIEILEAAEFESLSTANRGLQHFDEHFGSTKVQADLAATDRKRSKSVSPQGRTTKSDNEADRRTKSTRRSQSMQSLQKTPAPAVPAMSFQAMLGLGNSATNTALPSLPTSGPPLRRMLNRAPFSETDITQSLNKYGYPTRIPSRKAVPDRNESSDSRKADLSTSSPRTAGLHRKDIRFSQFLAVDRIATWEQLDRAASSRQPSVSSTASTAKTVSSFKSLGKKMKEKVLRRQANRLGKSTKCPSPELHPDYPV